MGIRFGKRLKSVKDDVVYEAVKRKATEDDGRPPEKRIRLSSIVPCDNELDVVSEAVKRKATEDDGRPPEKKFRLGSIVPCDNELDVVSEAVKRKATEDDGRPLEIPCDNELPSISGVTKRRNTPEPLRKRSAKRKAVADDGPVDAKKRPLDPSDMFEFKYQQQNKLGEGGFASVFSGYRKADNLPVAIKRIPRRNVVLMHKDDTGKYIPMEVAVMLKLAAESERHSPHVDLLDWYDLDEELILVLERPLWAEDLCQYIKAKGGLLKEEEAKVVTKQLADAAIDLQLKHIFHRDIKVNNLLIENGTTAPRVRVIDFGVSCFFEEGDAYHDFMGTHFPPEWFIQQEYKAGPTTVFQIGLVLFDMLHKEPYKTLQSLNGRLSKDCKDFMKGCLHEDPDERFTLEQLRDHLWMR